MLSGQIPAGETRAFRLDANVKLGNGGDTIRLLNAVGAEVQKVTYASAQRGKFVVVP